MKVFDLRCDGDHRFEGWFGSDADYTTQLAKHMIECPVCGSTAIDKLPSAPRLNLSGATGPEAASRSAHDSDVKQRDGGSGGHAVSSSGQAVSSGQNSPSLQGIAPEILQELERRYLAFAREVISKTENVGDRFADEARKIHYDEAPARGIRGVATPEQRQELIEEGIDVVSLPIPAALDGPLQ
ncbi:MAG TPA: DUF1178 family protein [Pararobbsia sp.]|nr:DUF1178 family protein [Pararobbsia sp.]